MTVISAPRLLVDGRLTGPGAVVVDEGYIAAVLDAVPAPGRDHLRLDEGMLTPGLLDLHNNGAFGVDFAEATPAEWERVLADLASPGSPVAVKSGVTKEVTR